LHLPGKGFLIRSRKRKKRQKSKAIPALWYKSKRTREAIFLLHTSDCCFTQTSAAEEVKSWCTHWAAGPDLSWQTHCAQFFSRAGFNVELPRELPR
jgi:hypothetical protein